MATAFHSSTPPPPSSIHTPSTPRFGYHDDYQPFSPRKSARVLQRSRSGHQTPPSAFSQNHLASTPQTSYRRSTASDDSSAPSSPQTASKKRTPRSSYNMSGRKVSGALSVESSVRAASSLGLAHDKKEQNRTTAVMNLHNGMLPTPDKTPKKAPTEVAPAITSIARNLFSTRPLTVEEVMPARKKGKQSRFSLDDVDTESQGPIAIFTDSQDRVPEVDNGLDNPFYGQGIYAPIEPVKRASKRQKISIPGEEDLTLEEAEKRQDGMVVVFRGKKQFRKFTEDELRAQGSDVGATDAIEVDGEELRSHGPTTRSSIKPRLLFPSAPRPVQKSHCTEDEEADTDIEEPMPDAATWGDDHDVVATPKAPRFAPASPPASTRATRSKRVDFSSSPIHAMSDDDMGLPQPGQRKRDTRKRQGTSMAHGAEKKLRR